MNLLRKWGLFPFGLMVVYIGCARFNLLVTISIFNFGCLVPSGAGDALCRWLKWLKVPVGAYRVLYGIDFLHGFLDVE